MFSGIVSVAARGPGAALVCVEGIEDRGRGRLCATDANADLVQGHYFASPARELPAEEICRDTFTHLFQRLFAPEMLEAPGPPPAKRALEPYLEALKTAGAPRSPRATGTGAAVVPLLALSCTQALLP